MVETTKEYQASVYDKGVALFRKPGDEMKVLISGRVIAFSGHAIPNADGFVFAPFQEQERYPKLFVISDQKGLFSGSAASFLTTDAIDAAWLSGNMESTSQRAYYDTFAAMHDAMKKGTADKIVLSKLVSYRKPLHQNWIHLFDRLCDYYPNAFVYVFASDATGMWMGATPEILLSHEDDMVKTVALAGTKAVNSEGDWRPKEFVEQNYVTRFIHEALAACGAQNIEVKGPVTVKAGQVVHLQTSFAFCGKELNSNIWSLVDRLHPTPAVSGYPKDEAIDIIEHHEQHDREYYAGYLGPVSVKSLNLYVNIRCMKVTDDGAVLFVGGGLTLDSVAEEEWNETELKSQTLLSVLQNREL
jgi:isochorismate synthases